MLHNTRAAIEALEALIIGFLLSPYGIQMLPQEDVVQGLSQWHTRFDFFATLSHFQFILGQTNFMVGSPHRRCDLLPSRFIRSEESYGQQGMPFSLTT